MGRSRSHARRRALHAWVWGLCVAVTAPLAAEGPEVNVVFRLDDYGTGGPAEIDDYVIGRMKAHGLCCTFGVIPFRQAKDGREDIPLTPEKVARLKAAVEAGIVEPAVHGYYHAAIGPYRRGKGNEWAGVPFERQKAKLHKARQYLQEAVGAPVTTFLPPWNRYDAHTVRALEEVGYRCLGTSRRALSVDSASLAFIPATCLAGELRQAVAQARRLRSSHHVIVCQLHPVDFKRDRGSLSRREFDDLLAWVASQKDVRVRTLGQLAADVPGFGASGLGRNKWYVAAAYVAPPAVGQWLLAEHVYLGEQIVVREALKAWGVLVGVYGLLAAAAMLVAVGGTAILLRKVPASRKIVRLIWPVLACAGLVYAALDARRAAASGGRIHGAVILTALVVGASLGVLWAYRRTRKGRASAAALEPPAGEAAPPTAG